MKSVNLKGTSFKSYTLTSSYNFFSQAYNLSSVDRWLPENIQDSSEKLLLLSSPSSRELEMFIKNLDEAEREEAERIKATGFNIFAAAKVRILWIDIL